MKTKKQLLFFSKIHLFIYNLFNSRCVKTPMNRVFGLTITLMTLLIFFSGKLSAQQFGSVAGTDADAYVINNDNSNHWAYLRLQTGNNQAWNLINQDDALKFMYAPNGDHGDMGNWKLQLTSGGDIRARGHVWLHAFEGHEQSGTAYIQARDHSGETNINLQFRTQINGGLVDAMRIKANGNVGIGTNDPDKGKLQVKGSVHVENNNGTQIFHISAGKQLVFVGDSAWIQYENSIDNAASPIQQNHFSMWVSKGIVTEDLAIVDPSEWADHVFDDSYRLAPLNEVESYIQANGHLPNIPSKEEVVENGYSVQTINAKFLEKIEELTLYSIAQDKKLKAQEGELEQLKVRLAALETALEKIGQ